MRAFLRSLLVLTAFLFSVSAASAQMEFNRDRPGGDITSFASPPNPAACQAACFGNPACRAWTYVKPGFQGPTARCWIKGVVPSKVKNNCCVSGLGLLSGPGPGPGGSTVEHNTDRPGSDYTSVNLPFGAGHGQCRQLCNADGNCKAWTFVKAGFQGPHPRCWLKNDKPSKVPNACCTSGKK
jgi:hypothetical protein